MVAAPVFPQRTIQDVAQGDLFRRSPGTVQAVKINRSLFGHSHPFHSGPLGPSGALRLVPARVLCVALDLYASGALPLPPLDYPGARGAHQNIAELSRFGDAL